MGGGTSKISEMSARLNRGFLLKRDAKWVLRMSDEKCLNAVEVFGFVMPIERNYSLLDCAHEPGLKIFALGCIQGIEN